MNKALVFACIIALIAISAVAQTPSQHRVTLAEIMAPAEAPAPAVAAQNQPVFLAGGRHGITPKALCQANCASGTVSCTASSPGACIAVDRNCPSTQGYVTCDGVTTYCSTSCQVCTPGAIRRVWYGDCCDLGGKAKEEEVCAADGSGWYSTGNVFCGGPCGPILP